MKKFIIVVIILVAVIGIGIYLAKQASAPVVTNNFAAVPGDTALLANLKKAGLDPLTAEGSVMHIHQHLDITINDQPQTVPGEIGIGTTFISPVHTHDDTGIIHVESPVQKDFQLGQFFDEWGVDFSDAQIGTNKVDSSHKLLLAVNGTALKNNYRGYVLKAHDEIEIWYGPVAENPNLIKAYAFAPGL